MSKKGNYVLKMSFIDGNNEEQVIEQTDLMDKEDAQKLYWRWFAYRYNDLFGKYRKYITKEIYFYIERRTYRTKSYYEAYNMVIVRSGEIYKIYDDYIANGKDNNDKDNL